MGIGTGLYMYVVVVQKFTIAISSPDEFLSVLIQEIWLGRVCAKWLILCQVDVKPNTIYLMWFYCIHFGKVIHSNAVGVYIAQCCRIRSDHNEDHSVAIINEWLNHTRDDYNDVDFLVDESETGAVWLFLMFIALETVSL